MQTDPIYGDMPVDLGIVDLSPEEMMLWLYCPVKKPGDTVCTIPENLLIFSEIIDKVYRCTEIKLWRDSYVYVTAKTLFVTPENSGNRPGWHSDGFLTDDINFIWYDSIPTVFWKSNIGGIRLTKDHCECMKEMEYICESDTRSHVKFPNKHLLKLDQSVIHKPGKVLTPCIRSFVKISLSKSHYALKGNSLNYSLPLNVEYSERLEARNCPRGLPRG